MQSVLESEQALCQLSGHICIFVPMSALQTLWPKMATLFALLHSCGWIIKMQKGPRSMRVCKSVCWGISIPLPWAICGQTDPIMFVLQDQIGCVSSSLAAHWCPFQPAPCTSRHPFQSMAPGMLLFCYSIYFGKLIQVSALDKCHGLTWTIILEGGTKTQRNNCIEKHQDMHIRACLEFKYYKCMHIITHLKPEG